MIPRAWIAAAVLTLLASAYAWGRHDGRALLQARLDAAAVKQAAADAMANARLAIEEQRQREISRDLEDQAHADPVAVPLCLSADRVRRLNRR